MSIIAVTNMPSASPVEVRIYDITSATLIQDWTNAGVVERAVGLDLSCYYYSTALTAGHAYQIDWRDSSVPTKVASEILYELQTNVNDSISSIPVDVDTQLSASHGAAPWGASGSGNTLVDHNTGGADNLRYIDSLGAGIDNADIKAYLKADYDADHKADVYVKDYSKTKTDGRWQWPMHLDSGFTYTLEFYKQGEYVTSVAEVTI